MKNFLIPALLISLLSASLLADGFSAETGAGVQFGYASRDGISSLRCPVLLSLGEGWETASFIWGVREEIGASFEVYHYDPFVKRPREGIVRIGAAFTWKTTDFFHLAFAGGWEGLFNVVDGEKAGGASMLWASVEPSLVFFGGSQHLALVFPVTASFRAEAYDVSAGIAVRWQGSWNAGRQRR